MKQKTFFLSMLFLPFAFNSDAQGIFNQNGEMIKRSIEQIGLLTTYSSELKPGYKIVEDGASLTHDIKNGEFTRHTGHYDSLEIVNSRIRNYPHIQETTNLYNKMTDVHTAVWNKIKPSGFFTNKELNYINGVYSNLLKAATADIQELKQLTTNGELKMTDDERITRIDKVYNRIRDKYKVITDFDEHILTVLYGRKAQKQDADRLKGMYGE